MNGIVIKENKKYFFSSVKTEDKEYQGKIVRIYKVSKINKKTIKNLIKKLKNDNINKVAVEENLERDLENEIDIVKEKDILMENLPVIVRKGAGVLGIKKGKLKLGIVADRSLTVLTKIRELKEILKTVYIFEDDQMGFQSWADSFFADTGIPVVIRKKIDKNQVDVLVICEGEKYSSEIEVKFILDFSGKNEGNIPKVKIPEEIKKYNLSNWVLAVIFETDYHLAGFAKKSLTQNHKNNIIV